MPPDWDDRRSEPRLDVTVKVDYSSKEMFNSNYVTNLSKGGVFIKTDEPLPLHTEIHLIFTLPDTNITIKATGKVVWTFDIKRGTGHLVPGMGIRFVDLSPDDRRTIEDYVQNLTSHNREPAL
jgi:type IV pilus assembly protein PilZ